jgi:hypothetical protein
MIKNCTPHPIVVRMKKISLMFHCDREGFELPPDSWEKETVFQPSGCIPRVGTVETPVAEVDGIPCVTQANGACQGLPDPEPGVFLLVSALVFGACDRDDLLAPDTSKTCIRDEQGRIVAVTRLIRRQVCTNG